MTRILLFLTLAAVVAWASFVAVAVSVLTSDEWMFSPSQP